MAGKAKHTKVVTLVAKDENGKIIDSYQTAKNTKTVKDKLVLKKYSKKKKTHLVFTETKSKS
ncbi:MAG: 50S ribosomal protein L33 [Candidatus Gracilibacteria bacterium]|nr:50S ribosomal protein L33 [Candidatus Peregrinibacteria bacterium]